MNFLNGVPAIASTVINPSTLVEVDPTGSFLFKAATGLASKPCFIAQAGPEAVPNLIQAAGGTAPTTQPAAKVGDGIGLFGPGDVCDVLVGSTALNPGDFFRNDLNAAAIPAVTGGWYCGLVLAGGNPGDLVSVLLNFGTMP